MENKRPFFSVIIPCYNSKHTIGRLLNSLVEQNLPYEELEVVLADDCSTESYKQEVDPFRDRLRIVEVKTEYNCCPGNTRQCGADAATGEWMVFSDHDDQFVPNTFATLKREIEKTGCQTFYLTRFYKRTPQGFLMEMPENAGWTHGKFFNRDNYWLKYNLHYTKDLLSHEDVCLTTQVEYLNSTFPETIVCYKVNLFTYVWNENPNSLSNRKYQKAKKERPFIDVFFPDYMQSTAGTVYEQYLKYDKRNPEFVKNDIMYVILYSYFYLEYAIEENPQYIKENYDKVKYYLDLLKNQFNVSIEDIYRCFKYEQKEQYQRIFQMALGQTKIFLYQRSFKEWLEYIYYERY